MGILGGVAVGGVATYGLHLRLVIGILGRVLLVGYTPAWRGHPVVSWAWSTPTDNVVCWGSPMVGHLGGAAVQTFGLVLHGCTPTLGRFVGGGVTDIVAYWAATGVGLIMVANVQTFGLVLYGYTPRFGKFIWGEVTDNVACWATSAVGLL